MKKCTACKQDLPNEAFSSHRRRKDGLQGICRVCMKRWREENRDVVVSIRKRYHATHREAIHAHNKEWRAANPERVREWERARYTPEKGRAKRLRERYGLTVEQYEALRTKQSGACAICHAELDDQLHAVVDHDHTSGAIRGILCRKCNSLLGMARESAEILRAAVAYLERSG